ncbi:ABC transporter permease [Ochrobactrum sp. Kaboul]|nr:ABC transporter permease [Ochrobactrum sp. Kaboul]
MTRYILHRFLQTIPVFFVISALVFVAVRLAPGDPISNALHGQVSQESINAIRAQYGLDQPLLIQYGVWIKDLLSGTWGNSLALRVPVASVLGRAFANTLILTGAAVLICLVFGTLIGLFSGLRQGSFGDRVVMLLVQVAHNLPVFWLGLILIWIFGVQLRWLPVSGMYNARGDQGLADLLRHLVLPALSAAIISMLILARMVRSSVIDIMNSDYIRTYRALGFPQASIVRRHVGRNLLSPVINMTGLQIGYLLSGVIFVENVFAWPGIGTQLYNAAAGRDYPMIQAGTMLITGCFLAVNLLTDIALDLLNPRLSRTASGSN